MRHSPNRLGAATSAVLACLFVVACGAGGRSIVEDDAKGQAALQTTGTATSTSVRPEREVATTDGSQPTSTTASSEATTTTRTPETTPSSSAKQTTEQTTTTQTSPADAPAPPIEVVVPEGAAARVAPGQTWTAFASFEAVTLFHPSDRVERIGFHESNHDGARQLEPTPDAIAPVVMDSRDRGTGSRTAADIVVEPGTEIRAPVTGTVIRAGGYVLYCDHQDDFAVIEPDAHPGWEVKVLHIDGVMVSAGDRVEAGVTVIAPAATVLPFDSQVDEFTATPPWPHVHIELVDPSIPDRPSTGGGC